MTIIPSLEETQISTLEERLSVLDPLVSRVQIDINDGSFANFHTLTPAEVGPALSKYNQKKDLEIHLMVQNPVDSVTSLKKFGLSKFIIQYEIEGNFRETLQKLVSEGIFLGLALSPETSVADIEPFLEFISLVNIMTIHTGKQGQDFLPENLRKISDLRNINFTGEIEVDGGINSQTISKILTYNPDTLIIGSFLWSGGTPKERFDQLNELL